MSTEANSSFSLYELNQHLKRVVAFNMQQPLWINCEIADVNRHRGNVYLSLVERDDLRLKAKADGMIWNKDLQRISHKIGDSLWSILQVGRQVLLQVQVEYHEYFGLKLSVKDIDPSVTIGQLELKRMQMLEELKKEQFTTLNAQLPAPTVWQRLAIISSENAAGLEDFLQHLAHNPYQYQYDYQLFEASMQGVNVKAEVMRQLQKIEAQQEAFDAVIIVRGGGARLDLMGFDDYDLCVAIATCELPVLTGIGHEIDETLADIVAYHPLKTPTAVADFLIQQNLEFETTIVNYQQQVKVSVQQSIQQAKNHIDLLHQQIKSTAKQRLQLEHQKVERLAEKINLLNPQATLKRGFGAIIDKEGKRITSIHQLDDDQTYTLQLVDGSVQIQITKK